MGVCYEEGLTLKTSTLQLAMQLLVVHVYQLQIGKWLIFSVSRQRSTTVSLETNNYACYFHNQQLAGAGPNGN